jgi:pilus assembly protein Flp/PilA
LRRFLVCESGATAVEYGLIVTLIFLAIVSAVTFFTSQENAMFGHINNAVGAATA